MAAVAIRNLGGDAIYSWLRSQTMEVTYATTIDDYVAFNMHALKRSRSMRRRFFRGWLLLPLGCFFLAIALWERYSTVANFALVATVVYGAFYPLLYKVSVERSLRSYANDLGARGVIGRITLKLNDESLTEQTETVQTVIRWRDMKGVEIVGDRTYIYTTGMSAAIVPRHGFDNENDYERVRDFAVAKLG